MPHLKAIVKTTIANSEGGLNKPVQFLKGVGPRRAAVLDRLGIATVRDVMEHYPREWQDRRPDGGLPSAATAVVLGRVLRTQTVRAGLKLQIFKAALASARGTVEAQWFKRPSPRFDVFKRVRDVVKPGRAVWAVGRPEPVLFDSRKLSVEEFYAADDPRAALHVNRIVPLYPLTEGVDQVFFRELVQKALAHAGELTDILPYGLRRQHALLAAPQAVRGYHFPGSPAERDEARRRLAYEELLLLETAWLLKHRQARGTVKGYGYHLSRRLLTPFKEGLGFDFTAAQRRAINEIFADLQSPHPMTRLVQGDVGSGKTVVALAALLLAVESGGQGAFLAPTEILAEQHALTFERFLRGLEVRHALLTSRTRPKERERILEGVRSGRIELLVGTHALLEERVGFKALRLAVVDEQHRFGVRQRATLRRKAPPGPEGKEGGALDVLVMTATPIPRTLALALYGDLDVSTIDELPPGRRPIETRHVSEREAFHAVREEALKGRRAYIVYPVIEESAALDIKAAAAEAERLRTVVFPDLKVGLIHGRMDGDRKAKAMEDFAAGRVQVLVATPVVEVGMDVPEATVMVIQNADRFGLASLHQLRGRVGRGPWPSTCLLVGEARTPEAEGRLKILCSTNDGFRIGEEDLRLRGPGELLGTEQHGELRLQVADPFRDAVLLTQARQDAQEILSHDPRLVEPDHAGLRERLLELYQRKWDWIDLA